MVSAEIVLADGTLTTVSEQARPNLFWVSSLPSKRLTQQPLLTGHSWILKLIRNNHLIYTQHIQSSILCKGIQLYVATRL